MKLVFILLALGIVGCGEDIIVEPPAAPAPPKTVVLEKEKEVEAPYTCDALYWEYDKYVKKFEADAVGKKPDKAVKLFNTLVLTNPQVVNGTFSYDILLSKDDSTKCGELIMETNKTVRRVSGSGVPTKVTKAYVNWTGLSIEI